MKSALPRLLLVVCCVSQILNLRAATPPAAYQAEADRLARELPSLYWHASDACLRETSRHGPQTLKYEEFVHQHRATIQKTTPLPFGNPSRVDYEINLADPADPREHWVFDFVYTGQKWEAKSGYKYLGDERAFDLYTGDGFLGSMKPYVQKALDTFSQHGGVTAVLPTPGETIKRPVTAVLPASGEAIKHSAPMSPFNVGDIIEQYRHYEIGVGLFPGQSRGFAHTKWKIRGITSNWVEVELAEGQFVLSGGVSKNPGYVLRLSSASSFRETFPDAGPVSEIFDTFRKVDEPAQ